jgi:CRISPR-associated protein Cas7/Csd2, subtype I-C/DVULG
MATLQNKIDFALLVSVTNANPNGDPLNGNRPRVNYGGYGEISDVCIKRKIRNRMQDMGQKIFVQSEDRCDDGFGSLSERASNSISSKTKDEYARLACEKWLDVRAFGQVFAFKTKDKDGVSVGVRGPVSVHQAISCSPVDIDSLQITKSVNGEPSEKRSSDTMGSKHMISFGLYLVKGSINVQLAEKTGFSEEDAETIRNCLKTLFVNDASAARPDGSMEVSRLYWWQHNCKDGQYSSARVHRSLQIKLKGGVDTPSSFDDYAVSLCELPDLKPIVEDGL